MNRKESIKNAFAEHLKVLLEQYRQKHKLPRASLRKLAGRSNLEYSQVQRIFKGKVDASLTTIVSLAEGLEVSTSEILNFQH